MITYVFFAFRESKCFVFSNKTLVGEENCYVMLAKWYTNVLKRVICPSCCSKGQGKKVGVFELEGSTPEMMAMMMMLMLMLMLMLLVMMVMMSMVRLTLTARSKELVERFDFNFGVRYRHYLF